MMELIQNNPFRFFGVPTNATAKEILVNVSRIKAFCNVGKTVTFPLDMNAILPEMTRSVEMIDAMNNALSLPEERLRYALFWFVNASSADAEALEWLQKGEVEQTLMVLWREQHYSTAINRGVVCLMKGDLENALKSYLSVIHDNEWRASFVHAVCGSNVEVSKDKLTQLLLDELCKELTLYELFRSLKKIREAEVEKNHIGEMLCSYAENELECLARNVQEGNNACEEALKDLFGREELKGLLKDIGIKTGIDDYSKFIELTYPYLAAIAEVEGEKGYNHQRLSTKVESVALNGIIEVINNDVKEINSGKSSDFLSFTLKMDLIAAASLMRYLRTMDIDSEAMQRLDKQFVLLENLAKKAGFTSLVGAKDAELVLKTESEFYRGCKTLSDYHRYIKRFPNGQYKRLVQNEIDKLDRKWKEISARCVTVDDISREYVSCQILGLLEELDDKCFSMCSLIEDYEKYHKLFGGKARHKKEVDAIMMDSASYQKCKTFQDYNNYLAHYPNGVCSKRARAVVDEMIWNCRGAISQCNQLDERFVYLKEKCEEVGLLKEVDDKCFCLCVSKSDYRFYLSLFGDNAFHKYEAEEHLKLETLAKKVWGYVKKHKYFFIFISLSLLLMLLVGIFVGAKGFAVLLKVLMWCSLVVGVSLLKVDEKNKFLFILLCAAFAVGCYFGYKHCEKLAKDQDSLQKSRGFMEQSIQNPREVPSVDGCTFFC